MERPSRSFTTARGTEVVVREYLTGGEFKQAQAVLLRGADIQMGSDDPMRGVKGEAVIEYETKLAELAIASIGGKSDAITDSLNNLPADEYNEIMVEVRKVANGFLAPTRN